MSTLVFPLLVHKYRLPLTEWNERLFERHTMGQLWQPVVAGGIAKLTSQGTGILQC